MAEPTPNPTKTTEPTPPTPPEPPAPNNGDNQKAIDDAVAAAKEKWEKDQMILLFWVLAIIWL